MKSLKKLSAELESLKAFQANARCSVYKEAEDVLRKKLTRSKVFLKMLKDVEASNDLTSSDDQYFSQYLRVDLDQFIDTKDAFQREVFQNVLDTMETFITIDFQNDCFLYSIGPCITINENASRREYFVYDQDSGKEIVTKEECLDENGDVDDSRRDALIEQWMNKKGYFPSVVLVSSYDGSPIRYVNTQSKKRGA